MGLILYGSVANEKRLLPKFVHEVSGIWAVNKVRQYPPRADVVEVTDIIWATSTQRTPTLG